MGAHINKDGLFQSDKYPTCPPGKVPLSVKDPAAQGLLWDYARRHHSIDPEFSEDLKKALTAAGFDPEKDPYGLVCPDCERLGNQTFIWNNCEKHGRDLVFRYEFEEMKRND